MTTETRNFALTGLKIRAKSDDNEGRATGYAAVFNSNSYDLGGFVERINPGAFKRSLEIAAAGETNIHALWAHRDDSPLGSTASGKLTLTEDDHGLAFDLDTARFTPAQLDALKDGDLRMSFGFRVLDQQWREDEDGNIERTLLEVDVFEISFVINPAYPATEAALRSLEAWRSAQKPENIVTVDENERVILFKRALSNRLR
ncbi:HK97 family phage prohead protease [Novosphingobium chloroacetimidivorans]|uniref:HK97 family phage prohead protease n=1 Tax=Novosphingobium chloroacetimidivorans TaxID=1428314 RepID=A0A7W7NXG9_9SPHN|nr:HK97 family phage prohead protease [Novosphingobium chloroacetimidivorans]MBB4859459.1 HK97 family phage prohead protease [Novosphingobium chloroacetimidivorans]